MTAEGSTGAPLRQQIAEAIARGVAEKYTSETGRRNRAWDIDKPDGPDNLYYHTVSMDQRVQHSPAIVALAADGYLSISHPSCVEIAEVAADAVVALLNLTEEWVPGTEDNPYTSFGAPSLEAARQHVEWLGGDADAHWYWKRELVSAVSFWQRLPSTPPHTSSSEPA